MKINVCKELRSASILKRALLLSVSTGGLFFVSNLQVAAQDCGAIIADTTISGVANGTCEITAPSVLTIDENGSLTNTEGDAVLVRRTDLQFSIINRGTIEGYAPIYIDGATGGELIRNFGTIRSLVSPNNFTTGGIYLTNSTTLSTLVNEASGVISGDFAGVYISGGRADQIYNFGLISGNAENQGGNDRGVDIAFNGTVGSLINYGVVRGEGDQTQGGDFVDIYINPFGNGGAQLIENLQRGSDLYSGQDRLFLGGELPLSYNIIIMSNESYGQLNVDLNGSGNTTTTFGISALSERFSATSFEAVMTGVSSEHFNNTTGTYFGADWNLVEQTQRVGVWDLLFQSTPLFDTYRSLEDMRDNTTGIMYNTALSVRSGLEIECTQFGEQGFCLRVGGRVDSSPSNDRVHTSFASLAGAFQINDTFRIGGYVDQQVAHTSTNGFDYQLTAPTLGAFLEYGNVDGSGVQVRVAASRASGELTTTRGLSLTDTEYGRGEADVTASGVHGRIGYGLAMENGTIVTPYVGLWRVGVERGAYREGLEPNVRYPFSYDAYEMTETATVLGMTIDGDLQQGVSFRGDFGLETGGGLDTNAFSGSSNLTEVSEFSFDALEPENDTRFFAGASLNFIVNETADFEVGAMVREAASANDINVSTRASFIFRF